MPAESVESQPQCDVAIEEALLGAIIINPRSYREVEDVLRGSDFFEVAYGQVYDLFGLLLDTEKYVDESLLLSRIKRYGIDSQGMTTAKIVECIHNAAPISGLRHYANLIVGYSCHRKLQRAALRAVSELNEPKQDPHAIGVRLVSAVESISDRQSVEIELISESAKRGIARIREQMASDRSAGCSTGLQGLDAAIGGLCKSELITLAARPGSGKTALAMQMCHSAALEGNNVLFVSLEMRREELSNRVLCALSGVNGMHVRSGSVAEGEITKLEVAQRQLEGLQLRLCGASNTTVAKIRSAAKLAAMDAPLSLLCVDYLNLIRPERRNIHRVEQISEITSGLKEIAKDLELPVLALCQLNREAEGERPKLSHLKEGGSIEQDSDVVLAIHHDEKELGQHRAEILILKNRHGKKGSVLCDWHPAATRFEETEPLLV